MMARFVGLAICALVLANVANAKDLTLSDSGTFLGRVSLSDLKTPVQITVNLYEDKPVATYVMARFQNNTPLHRIQDGDWVRWRETSGDLIDAGFEPNPDGTLTFVLVNTDLSVEFLPVIFTVAYALEDGILKSGYMVVDQ